MKINTEKIKREIIVGVCAFIFVLALYLASDALVAFAAEAGKVDVSAVSYTPLAPLPLGKGGESLGTYTLASYLSGMLRLIIALGGAISILMAIVGGVQYVASGIAPSAKNEAKGRITNAFIGLAIILSSYLLLNTINPDLVNLKFSLEKVTGTHSKEAAGGRYVVYDTGNLGSGSAEKGNVYMFGSKELCEKGREGLIASNKNVSKCEPEGGPLSAQAARLRPIGCPRPEPNKVAIRCELCGDCAAVPSDINKGCGISKSDCRLDKDLLAKIQKIDIQGWQITESWPPTVDHESACHANGQCADINTLNKDDISPTTIKKYYDAFERAGLNVLYENRINCEPYKKVGIRCAKYDTMTNNSSFHVK